MSVGGITRGTVRVDHDLEIYFETAGEGPVNILIVPGWTMSTRVFENQLGFFAHHPDFRFITYDPRGQGLSSKTPGGHHYEQHGRDLHHFIEALDLKKLVLGGWSYGVLEALSYADQFGAGKLVGLVMLDGSPKSKGADNQSEWVSFSYDDADGQEAFFTLGPLRDRSGFNREFATWMLEDASARNIDWVCAIANQTTSEVAALLNATGTFLDYTETLQELGTQIPLLHVVCEARESAATRWSQEHTPTATVAAFGKHLMFWERPKQFNAALTAFLRGLTVN